MVKVVRAFCWHQNFDPKGLSALPWGYICIKWLKMYIKSELKRDHFETCNKWSKWSGLPVGVKTLSPRGCLLVAFYHCFFIGNNVNISSPCSKTVHTKFTEPLILRGRASPPIWSKNTHFLPSLVWHYFLCSWYTMSSHRIVLLIFLHRVH